MCTGKAALCGAMFLLLTSASIARDGSTITRSSFPNEVSSSSLDGAVAQAGYDTCGRASCGDCDTCGRAWCGECDTRGRAWCGDGACCDPQPRFFVTAEALFLKLDHGSRQAVPVVINQDTGETVLTTHNLVFNMVSGSRVGFGYILSECETVEVSYFGLHHWDATAEALGNNNLRLPGDLALATQDFFNADRMRLGYTSELHNAEGNYFCGTCFDDLSFLVGFRYLSLNETFNINAADIDAGRSSDYNIHAFNQLYGAQFGARWRKDFDKFGLDFVGKGGIFGNAAKQHTFVGDFDNTFVVRNLTTDRVRTAFIGELGFSATYQVTSTLYAKAGYNLLWVEGIARAPDQLDFTDTPESGTALVIGKGAFLHGANVGLEARW